MQRDGVPSATAAQIAGVSLASVNQLAATGVLLPATPGFGRGTSRRYSFSDLCALRFLAVTRPFGISPSRVLPAVRHIQSMALAPEMRSTGASLAVAPDGAVRVVTSNAPDSAKERRSTVELVVDVDALVDEVAAAELQVLMLRDGLPPRGRGRPRSTSEKAATPAVEARGRAAREKSNKETATPSRERASK